MMNFSEIINFIDRLKTGYSLTGEEKEKLKDISKMFNVKYPSCNCNDKLSSLLFTLKMMLKDKTDFPKYRWISERARFRFGDVIFTAFNHPDSEVEKYIKENPDQKDFELWNKEENIPEQPKKKSKKKVKDEE